AVAVIDLDHVAVTRLPATRRDAAISRSADRRARGRAVVHAAMRAHRAEDRVHARHREARADAREFDRRAKEGLAQAAAVPAEVFRAAVAALKTERGMVAALVVEAGGEDVAVAQLFSVAPDLLVHDGEAVA